MLAAGTLTATEFNTELGYDYLTIGDARYQGSSGPQSVRVGEDETFTWRTDSSVTNSGWVLCWGSGNPPALLTDSPTSPTTTAPTVAGCGGSKLHGLRVTSGAGYCSIDANGCATDGAGSHGSYEACTIEVLDDGFLSSAGTFNVEYCGGCRCDALQIGGTKYCGRVGPSGVAVSAGATFTWSSDRYLGEEGWTVCWAAVPPTARPTATPPPVMPGLVQLVRGPKCRGAPYCGLLEVSIGGLWGTVCGDYFRSTDARVVCRELGMSGGNFANFASRPYQGERMPVLMTNVTCSGFERSILQCPYYSPSRSCDHSDDVYVACGGEVDNTVGGTGVPDTTSDSQLSDSQLSAADAAFICFVVLASATAALSGFRRFVGPKRASRPDRMVRRSNSCCFWLMGLLFWGLGLIWVVVMYTTHGWSVHMIGGISFVGVGLGLMSGVIYLIDVDRQAGLFKVRITWCLCIDNQAESEDFPLDNFVRRPGVSDYSAYSVEKVRLSNSASQGKTQYQLFIVNAMGKKIKALEPTAETAVGAMVGDMLGLVVGCVCLPGCCDSCTAPPTSNLAQEINDFINSNSHLDGRPPTSNPTSQQPGRTAHFMKYHKHKQPSANHFELREMLLSGHEMSPESLGTGKSITKRDTDRRLVCTTCQNLFEGQADAQAHTKATLHGKFREGPPFPPPAPPRPRAAGCVQVIPRSHENGVLNRAHHSSFHTDAMVAEHCPDGKLVDLELKVRAFDIV